MINENDAVATEELAYGDNDHLAALVASMLEADLLVLLSDVDGLFDGDPRDESTTRHGSWTPSCSEDDLAGLAITGQQQHVGRLRRHGHEGRLRDASRRPARVDAVVANARRDGGRRSTWWPASRSAPGSSASQRRMEARRLWIGFALGVRGTVPRSTPAPSRPCATASGRCCAVGVTERRR